MKRIIFLFLLLSHGAQSQEFKFAFVTDVHIGASTSEEDLQRTIADINNFEDLDFALFTGDITEMGTDREIALAEDLISKLDIPYYVLPGNHDTGWSESGGVSFIDEFGSDKFVFEHEGFKFIGTASGPYVRMSDGHIPRDAIVWLDSVLKSTPRDQPIIFINHYPLNNSLDNWFEATDRLRGYNTQFALCGHGHRNRALNFEGIPGTMGRSNLRADGEIGGYNIVQVENGVATFSERNPGKETKKAWREIALGDRVYDQNEIFERPSYAINDSFPEVKKQWEFHSDANVISTPAHADGKIIFGNSNGKIQALSEATGKPVWTVQTEGGIFSSPAVFKESVILGSGNGNIYSLGINDGQLKWKFTTEAAVLGSPIVKDKKVFIGGSDGKFRALNAATGQEIWSFAGLEGPVVSTPLLYDGKVIFGAWDRHLYALDQKTGALVWKWDNGSQNRMFSPAMNIPVAAEGVVYIVAPDRFLSAIDAETGKTLWRTDQATVRESIGITTDKDAILGKTMNDTIVAFETNGEMAKVRWKMDVGFGYDHVPSMLFEKNGNVFFGTRNGIVYSIDPEKKKINWAHKIDNSMVNTIRLLGNKRLVAATMDGKIAILSWR